MLAIISACFEIEHHNRQSIAVIYIHNNDYNDNNMFWNDLLVSHHKPGIYTSSSLLQLSQTLVAVQRAHS